MLSPLSQSLFSVPGEVVNILAGVASGLKACWDVVDLLRSAPNHASVLVTVLVTQGGGRDVVHVLWNRCVLVAEELAWRGLFDPEVWRNVIRLLSGRLWVGNISADGWREVIDLRSRREGGREGGDAK